MIILNMLKEKKQFFLGFLFLIFVYFSIIIMNKDMLNIIHDEFDIELLSYVYNAKYLNSYKIPEFLNGADKFSMIPAAPLLVYLFKFLDVPSAYFINYIFIVFVSYVGMYLLVNELLHDKFIATVSAVCFSLLPFYPMFGLTVMGQPLLFYYFLRLFSKKKVLSSYVFILIFTGLSSMVLVGAHLIIILTFIMLYIFYKKSEVNYSLLVGLLILSSLYIIYNIDLIYSVLGLKGGFISHRVEWEITANGILDSLRTMLWKGQYHAASCHSIIFIGAVVLMSAAYIRSTFYINIDQTKFVVFKGLLSVAFFIALFYGLWNCEFVVEIRKLLGGFFITFQADRFYFFYPTIWWLIFAYCIYFFKNIFKDKRKKFIAIFIVVNFLFVLSKSTVLVNWRAFLDDNYINQGYASVNEFYQPELFYEIDNYIGKEKREYKVASIGLYPSIALYNGFYCIDGYSTNYSLKYKHEFRDIISCELDKMGDSADYFDKWGSRCYIFVNDIYGKGYYISKNLNLKVNNLDLNFKKLKNLNCQYIFSSVEINDLKSIKLEKKFSDINSPYDIYLYKIL